MGQGLGRAEHGPQARRCDAAGRGEWGEGGSTLLQEYRLVIALDLLELRRTGQRRDHARYLAALQQHAVDIGRRDDAGPARQRRFAGLECGIHQRGLARIEFLVERREQPGPGAEMVIDDGLGDARLLREPSQGQGFRAFFAD
ncbi:hypothetical protein D3C81_1751670 [compost metagenome]